MEFHIDMTGSKPDLASIEHAIRAVDPSALVDIDAANQTLRVAASVDAVQLVSLIRQAGYPVAQHQIAQTASTCCGGCGG